VAQMDLATDAFATSRRSLIEQRLQEIRSQSMPKLLAEAWIHYGSLLTLNPTCSFTNLGL
jgi:hypothetical protein